jgi:ribosomal protein S27E
MLLSRLGPEHVKIAWKMTDDTDSQDLRVNCPDCERTIALTTERLRMVPTVRCPGCGRDLTTILIGNAIS